MSRHTIFKNTLFFAILSLFLMPALGAQGTSRSSMVPDQFLRGYDPVTLFYENAVVTRDGGPADGGSEYLSITPNQPGEYRWLDERTIQFLPAVPWPPMREFHVKSKDADRVLTTMMVPPTSISPGAGSKGLDSVSGFTLVFPASLDANLLSSLIKIEIRDLPGIDASGAQQLGPGDFTLRELENQRSLTSSGFRLQLKQNIGAGKRVILTLRLARTDAIPDAVAVYSFETKQEFRISGVGSGSTRLPLSSKGAVYAADQAIDAGSNAAPLWLEFSEAVAPASIETLKNLIRFEPAVRNIRIEPSGERIYIRFDADKEQSYRVRLTWQSEIKSVTGRPLSAFNPSEFWFFYRQASPYINWRSSDLIVERFGPQMLPMEGRGIARVDLRIQKIDPESLDFWPFPKTPVVIHENAKPPMPGEEPDPGSDLISHIRLLGSPEISKIVDLPIGANSGRSNFGLDLKNDLAGRYGKEEPGTYLVGYRTLDSGDERRYVRMHVTDLSLSTVEEEDGFLFAVTSLKTGAPVPGADISIEGGERIGNDKTLRYETLLSGTTDSNGWFRYQHNKAWRNQAVRIIIEKDRDSLILDARNPPPVFANNHWFSGNYSWLDWLTDIPRQMKHTERDHGWIVTERPVYRPEEPVHIAGWIRERRDGKILAWKADEKLNLVIDSDEKQWIFEVQPTGLGRVYKEFSEAGDITGDFHVQLRGVKTGTVYAQTDFKKEAYRVPLFEVSIVSPDRVALDKAFEAKVVADYYAGGRVVGEEVEWEVTQFPYSISAPGYEDFVFSTEERFANGSGGSDMGAMRSSDTLDDEGSATLRINPAGERDGRARRYVIEATVQGGDRQTVTQTRQVLALPPFVLGLKLPRFAENGKSVDPSIIVFDHNEKALAGLPLTLRLYQRQWHSYIAQTDFTTGDVRYETDVVDAPVSEQSFISIASIDKRSFAVRDPGVYVVELSARDNLGRRVVVKSDMFVSGASPVSWERKKESLFELSADQSSYRPGQNAKIIIKSPYQDAWALVALEKPEKNEYSWIQIKNGQGIFSFAVTASMAPNIPVAVLLERGRVPGTETVKDKVDLGRPSTLGASLSVRVQATANQAILKLTHPEKAVPATILPVDLDLRDPDGKPLDGEVALWLVDKAVLSLGVEKSIDGLPNFIDPVASWLRLRDTRNLTVGNLPLDEIAGGDGFLGAMAGELLNKTTVRKNFKTVPYFNPAVIVKNGKAHVDVDLPDNLTDFAVRAIAVSGYERFGNAKSVVSVRLPVIVQSAVPRFARPGDSFNAGGLGRVVEGTGGPAIAGIKVDTFNLAANAGKAVAGDPGSAVKEFTLDDKKAARLFFPIEAALALKDKGDLFGSITVFVQRLSDKAKDAFSAMLPIREDLPVKRLQATEIVTNNRNVKFPDPAEAPRPDSVKRTLIVTRDQRLLYLIQALMYQRDYGFDCVEQRISKLYPVVALKQLIADTGMPNDFKIDDNVLQNLFTYIASTQDSEGLVSYWPGSTSYVSLTAYVLEFMSALRDAKFTYSKPIADKAAAALRRALRSDYNRLASKYSSYERVEALAALDSYGLFDEAYARELLTLSPNLPAFSQAKLVLVLAKHKMQTDTKAVAAVKRLEDMVTSKKEGNSEVYAGLQDKLSLWGGPVLSSETRTLGLISEVLTQVSPRSAKLAIVNEALIARGGPDGWGSTIDNVAAMRALRSLVAPNAANNLDLTLTSNGAKRTLSMGKKSLAVFNFPDPGTVTVSAGDMPKDSALYMTLWTEYKPNVRGSRVTADSAGFSLTRELIRIAPDGSYGTIARVVANSSSAFDIDQIVEDHTTLINFENREFVAVTIPMAAGFEPLNPELATSPKEAQPSGQTTLKPSYASYLDDKVVFYYENLPKGSYQFYFRVRASFEGTYSQPPARAEQLYALKVRGSSPGTEIKMSFKDGDAP